MALLRGAAEVPQDQRWQERVGVDLCCSWCWEYQSLHIPCTEDADFGGRVAVRRAWWGHPVRESLRRDVTSQVAELLRAPRQDGEAGPAADGVPATTAAWGDPARFMLKQLSVQYEFVWLDDHELAALEHLQDRANSKAMEQKAEVEALLSRIRDWGQQLPWSGGAVTGTAGTPGDEAEAWRDVSPRWKRLGFQSNDPRTDLRTGILALDCLVYLVERYPQHAQRMVVEAASKEYDYPLAVASINVTQLLAKFLRLLKGLTQSQQSEAMIEDRGRIRAFARLCAAAARAGWDCFGELHCAMMLRVHQTWKEMKSERPELNVFGFAEAMEDAAAAMQEFFCSAPLERSEEFPAGFSEIQHIAPLRRQPPPSRGHSLDEADARSLAAAPLSPEEGTLTAHVQAAASSAYSMFSGLMEPPAPASGAAEAPRQGGR